MPINQERIIAIVEEAFTLKDYGATVRAIADDTFNRALAAKTLPESNDIVRSGIAAILSVQRPETEAVLKEHYFFKSRAKWNERRRNSLRRKRTVEKLNINATAAGLAQELTQDIQLDRILSDAPDTSIIPTATTKEEIVKALQSAGIKFDKEGNLL